MDQFSPAVRSRHRGHYARPESSGPIVGIYATEPVEYDMEKLPKDFDMSAMKAGRDNLNVASLIHLTQQRFPWTNERDRMTISKGIMTFTPDGKGLGGPLPEVPGLFHCSCCSGHGITQSPNVGKVMADLILDGKTQYDLEFMAAARFQELPGFQKRADRKRRCHEMYASYYGQVEKLHAVVKN